MQTMFIKINNFLQVKNIMNIRKYTKIKNNLVRPLILGIETSCDDTGAALIDSNGIIYGESLHSQQNIHLRYGGIIPPKAQQLHRANIENVVANTFKNTEFTINDVDAIAVTNRPGLELSLLVGIRYAKHLARLYNKPIIPIHHMEAHALTARIENSIKFPFLCLLASGGHCLLTYVRNVNEFLLLGETLDDAPGEAFDKISRRLKLRNLPEYEWYSGGQCIELAAKLATTTNQFSFALPIAQYRNCQFSFAGLKNQATRQIIKIENDLQLAPDTVIPSYREFCNSFLKSMARHICHRTQRAIEYCLLKNLFNDNGTDEKALVFSGGVACNDYIFTALEQLTNQYDFKLYRPTKKLCTDNGIMIAWNGIERYLANTNDLLYNFDGVDAVARCKLGINRIDDVTESNIKCKLVKLPILRQ